MSNDNGSPPDDNADAAGEVLTEIGGAPPENGGDTSATATASSISETARVLLASPPRYSSVRFYNAAVLLQIYNGGIIILFCQ